MAYNGWKNYETWAVGLWLDNDEGSYNYVRELADDAREQAALSQDESWATDAKFILEDTLKQFVDETMPELPASLASDLLNAALSEVDWRELAEHYLAGD